MFFNIFLFVFAICAILLVYKYQTSHTVRYNVKFASCFIIVMMTGVLAIPVAMFRAKDVRNISVVATIWAFVFKAFRITYDLRNGENLKSDKPYVLVSNHQSSLDVVAMMTLWPERCTALAKKELLFFGPFGLASYLCGLVFIDRLNHEKAKGTLEKTAQHMHDANIKIWVFPEGTRNRDGNMLPFKKGAFNIAVTAQVPIVPMVLSRYRHFHDKNRKIFNPGHVIVTCLPPVPTVGLTAADVPALTQRIHDDMEAIYESSSVEVEEYARKVGNTEVLDLISKQHEE